MKPAFFIVPGSFSPSTFYVPLREKVQGLGYDSYILPLQTVGLRPSPPPTMFDDAAFISSEIGKLVSRSQEVIVLGHSYGGVPMTQSTKGLTVSERHEAGLQGGIKRLIYASAYAPPIGGNLVEESQALPPAIQHQIDEMAAYFPRSGAIQTANYTFNDLHPAAAQEAAAQIFQEQAVSGYIDNITWTGYSNVSTTYIHTLLDEDLSPETQNNTIRRLNASSPSFDLRTINAGHASMFTQLDKFVDILQKVLELE